MPEPIVMFDSVAAAWPTSIPGWRSRSGRFYFDEHSARYDGCTHRPCDQCGKPAKKIYVLCEECRLKAMEERYQGMPEAPWDGNQMLYSETLDEYFANPGDALDELPEGDDDLSGLRLLLCEPLTVPVLDEEWFIDELPEDGEAPDELLEAIDAFNEKMKDFILSWVPSKTRMKVDG